LEDKYYHPYISTAFVEENNGYKYLMKSFGKEYCTPVVIEKSEIEASIIVKSVQHLRQQKKNTMSSTTTNTLPMNRKPFLVVVGPKPNYLAKFHVSQSSFLKSSKRLLCLNDTTIHLNDCTSNENKLEIQLQQITNITAAAKQKEEFTIQYKNQKGKACKETFSSSNRDRVLSCLLKLKYKSNGNVVEKHFVTKWTRSNQRVDYLLMIVGCSLLKIDAMNTTVVLNEFDLMDIQTIFKIRDNRNAVVIQFKHSHRTHYYICSEVDRLINCIQKQLKDLL
jgi:hypothetical protein